MQSGTSLPSPTILDPILPGAPSRNVRGQAGRLDRDPQRFSAGLSEPTLESLGVKRVFISRAGADAAMAAVIGRILEEAGYSVILQQWDFANRSFINEMHEAVGGGARVVALLSPEYLASDHCAAEWQNTLVGDPLNSNGRLVVLRVAECTPHGLLAGLAYWDVVPVRDNPALLAEIVRDALQIDRQRTSGIDRYWRDTQALFDDEGIRAASAFTGRAEELAAIESAFAGGATAVTLHGLGGVGKTTLAREYAWRMRECCAVVWRLSAETEDGIIADLVRLGGMLVRGLDKVDDQRAAALQVKNNLLAGFSKPVLLLFDNLEDEELLRTWRPHGARILITSRSSVWASDVTPIALGAWSRDDALRYLQRESGRQDLGDPGAAELCEALGDLPLALSHAAAYLKATRTVTPQAYLARIVQQMSRAPRGAEYQRAVFATFQTAIAEAEAQAEGAAAVLCLAGFFAPDAIPEELFQQNSELYGALKPALPDARAAADLRSAISDPILTEEAIGALDRLSLIAFSPETRTFSMHRLVQAAARDLAGDEAAGWLESAVNALGACFPHVEFGNWPLCERLLPHAETISERTSELGLESFALARLLHESAVFLSERARVAEAHLLLERALAIRERLGGPDHPGVAATLHRLAFNMCCGGHFAEARPFYDRALDILERTVGAEHPLYAETLNDSGELFRELGRYEEAESIQRRSLEIRERALGRDHPDVASSLNDLACPLAETGKYDEAEPLFLRVIAILEAAHVPTHPFVARAYNNLAFVYDKQGRIDEARVAFENALARKQEIFGPEHPDVALTANNLAGVYEEQGRLDEAEAIYARNLSIIERAYGPDHPELGRALNNLAKLYAKEGRIAEALPLALRALELWEVAHGSEHPLVATALHNLGTLHLKHGRSDEARAHYERALAIRKKLLGADHADTISTHAALTDLNVGS
jgi:tetratricopeptide (TPR) repeat protein